MTKDAKKEIRGVCQLGEHQWCDAGPVVTSCGQVALVIRCDCPCHGRKERQ